MIDIEQLLQEHIWGSRTDRAMAKTIAQLVWADAIRTAVAKCKDMADYYERMGAKGMAAHAAQDIAGAISALEGPTISPQDIFDKMKPRDPMATMNLPVTFWDLEAILTSPATRMQEVLRTRAAQKEKP